MSNYPDYQKPVKSPGSSQPQMPYVQPGIMHSEMEIAAARMKSYTGAAVLVFFLYVLFYIPGLIVNFIYYSEAQRMQKIAGQPLPGQGCLAFMLWMNIIAIVLTVVGFLGMGVVALLAGM